MRKNLILSAGITLMALLATVTVAQTPRPSPSPSDDNGDYTVTSSIEIGVRGLSVNGDNEKFRSDLNYRPGLRAFNSSFFVENRSKGNKLFDEALFQASGWGGDPTGSARVNMSRTGWYKFDSNVRRVRYYNNLNNFAHGWAFPANTGSEHRFNTLRHFGDFDLTVFPESEKFRMRFGYSFNDQDGPGAYTIRFPAFEATTYPGTTGTRVDEFMVNSQFKNTSHDIRLGVEGQLFGFNVGLNYGHRMFRDRTIFFLDGFSRGNDPSTNTTGTVSATANDYRREFPTTGATDYANFYIQRRFAKKLDFTGRFIYALSTTNVRQNDMGSGMSSGGTTGGTARVLIDLDRIMVTGKVKRPQARGDIGLTYHATDKFRISNTFNFDQFTIGGSADFFERLVGHSAATPVQNFDSTFDALFTRGTSYRRFTNLLEADYQVNRHFAFNIGWRYTHRRVGLGEFEFNRNLDEIEEDGFDSHTNSTNSVIVGAKVKPTDNWSIYADFEKGTSDNVFFRLSNNDFTNFRVRSIANFKKFTLNFSGLIRNNDNPGTSVPILSGTTVVIPATETVASTKLRYFSGSIDYTPIANWSFSGGYTHNFQTSDTDVIVPVGSPIVSPTTWFVGKSMYFVRNNYFFFDVTARPVKRLTLFASYRIDDDGGQGDRVTTRPQDIITSYPMRFQTPEVKLSFRINRYMDWNVGYQYYSYRESQIPNPFARIVLTGPPAIPNGSPILADQNYTAHMPYTSLTIYFGRSADR
jgi:hypothetical protein